MSTTATPAAAAAAPAAGAATVPPNKISADIRRRAQGLTSLTKEQIDEEEKKKADKVAADALAKTAADKKAADEAAVAAAGVNGVAPVVEKVKRVKAGPPLPEPTPAAGKTVEEQVREAIAKDKGDAPAAPVLAPEVEREVELARFAAKKHPDRYTGQAEKIVGFYQNRDAMLAEKAKELGGQQTGEFKDYLESEEFKEWVRQNRPAYQRGDVAKLQEDMIADRARAEARAEMAPEIRALERKTLLLEHEPAIKKLVTARVGVVLTNAKDDPDPALAEFMKDPNGFGAQHPDEARIIASEAAHAAALIEELHKAALKLVEIDPKLNNDRDSRARQEEINQILEEQDNAMRATYPTGVTMPDGKIVVDRLTYEEKKLHHDRRYRTPNAEEISGMMAATANANLLAKLRQRREGVTKSIYAPKGTPAAAATTGQAATTAADDPPSPDAVVSRNQSAKGKTSETKMQTFKNRHLNGKH